jgi:putative hemolysin
LFLESHSTPSGNLSVKNPVARPRRSDLRIGKRHPSETPVALLPDAPGSSRRLAGIVVLVTVGICGIGAIAFAQTHVATTAPEVVAPTSDSVRNIALIVLLTLINAAFSMAETALVSIRPSRVEQLIEEGRRGALVVKRLVSQPPRFIATTQVGITILGFASAAAAATTLAEPLVLPIRNTFGWNVGTSHTVAIAFVTLLVALLQMVLGEIAPKSLAVQAPDTWALRLAPFINLCAVLFTPLTSLVVGLSTVIVRPFGAKARFETPFITREEFEHMITTGEKHGELDEEETTIIKNVFDLSETPVRAVMTPRIYMAMLALDATLAKTVELILESGHSRIPVYEETVDNIVGIVHAKDLLPLFRSDKHDVDLAEVMRDPFFVPLTRSVKDLLEEFRRSNQQLAIVQDEYGGTAGLVSIEDLLEEIVGDIRDEYDVDEPDMQVLSASESVIDGRMGIDDVNDRLGTDLPHEEYTTVGGLVVGLLGHHPVAGDRAHLDGIDFLVESVDGRRIHSVRALRHPQGDTETEDATADTGPQRP